MIFWKKCRFRVKIIPKPLSKGQKIYFWDITGRTDSGTHCMVISQWQPKKLSLSLVEQIVIWGSSGLGANYRIFGAKTHEFGTGLCCGQNWHKLIINMSAIIRMPKAFARASDARAPRRESAGVIPPEKFWNLGSIWRHQGSFLRILTIQWTVIKSIIF